MRTSLTRCKHFVGGSCGNFAKIEGEKMNTYVYMAGEFCCVKYKQCNDIIYLKRKNFISNV